MHEWHKGVIYMDKNKCMPALRVAQACSVWSHLNTLVLNSEGKEHWRPPPTLYFYELLLVFLWADSSTIRSVIEHHVLGTESSKVLLCLIHKCQHLKTILLIFSSWNKWILAKILILETWHSFPSENNLCHNCCSASPSPLCSVVTVSFAQCPEPNGRNLKDFQSQTSQKGDGESCTEV